MTDQSNLFPPASDAPLPDEAVADADAAAVAGGAPLSGGSSTAPALIPTSRNNILEWLSSGLVTPLAAFSKYYEDGLSVAVNAVPVVRATVGADLLEVEGGPLTNFPVLAEVDPALVEWKGEGACGLLPTSTLAAITAFHFADDDQLEEFSARSYDNVPDSGVATKVSPGFFSGAGLSREQLAAHLGDAPQGTPADFEQLSRLGGARLLGLTSAGGDEGTLRLMAAVAFQAPPRKRKRGDISTWLSLDPSLKSYKPAKAADIDERIFRAAASVFLELRRGDAWDGPAVLTGIDARLTSDPAVKDKDLKRWSAAADRTRLILDGSQAFEGFQLHEFRAEKALLLALIRSSPDDVLAWDDATGAHPLDLVMAACLVGLVHARKSCPVRLRPSDLDRALALRELQDLRGEKPEAQPVLATTSSDGDGFLELRLDDSVLLRVPRPPRTAEELFDELDVAQPKVEEALLALAAKQGWDEAISTTVTFDGRAEVIARGGRLIVAAAGTPAVASRLVKEEFRAALCNERDPAVRESMGAIVRSATSHVVDQVP